jgi:hypothetical protein
MKKIALCILLILCFCVAYAGASMNSTIDHQKSFNSSAFIKAQKTNTYNSTQFLTKVRVAPVPVYLPKNTTKPLPYLIRQAAGPAFVPETRADYYSVVDVDPRPYMAMTDPKKVATWFDFSADETRWRINWDNETRPLKYIIIHTVPNVSVDELNTYYKNHTYEPRYRSDDNDPFVQGLDPHSGHFMSNGKESFISLHWLIYPDGTVAICTEPTLILRNWVWYVKYDVWGAGNWIANTEGLQMGFALDDMENGQLTQAQINSANWIIKSIKAKVPSVQIRPHYSFNSQSNDPSYEPYKIWGPKLH